MSRTHRHRSLAVGVVAGLVTAGAILSSWTAVQAETSRAPEATKGVHVASPRTAVAGGQTERYTGIHPCRIIDTRLTGVDISARNTTFAVDGDLTDQGGHPACGIPEHATSIYVNLTGISHSPGGYVRGWATGETPPKATLLNYAPAINASNGVDIPLCRTTCKHPTFDLRAFGGDLDLVADVVGYYTAPAYITVHSFGHGYESSGVVDVAFVETGVYDVTFDRDISDCTPATTSFVLNRVVSVAVTAATVAEVSITDLDGVARNNEFALSFDC